VDQLAVRLIEFVGQQNNPIGWTVLGLSALIEYVFPLFPGDTVTLFGAFLITAKGWSFVAVLTSVLFGSVAGAWLDFRFGKWLKHREATHAAKHPKLRERVDRLVDRFKRHGEVYIVLNRFVPGIRPLFFVAAGMAGMRTRWVLLWALVSAALWNLLLIAIGVSLGANFEELRSFLKTYSTYAYIILGGLVLLWIVRMIVRKLRKPEPRP
jgi:membrane protein DedA with SNARE-associated domain